MAKVDEAGPALVWAWSHALLGTAYAVPPAALVLTDPARGLALAVGVLPAAAFGLPGLRQQRIVTIVLGVLTGISMFIGGVLAQVPALAVPAIFGFCVLAALAAPKGGLGRVALGLCVPLIGIGLSFDDLSTAVGAALLMVLGSVYALLISLAWPERAAADRSTRPRFTRPRREMLGYGIRLGLAGALAAAIGFWLHFDHVGWATGAALLVMHPVPEMIRTRAVDRVVSVLIGAAVGGLLMRANPPGLVVAAALLGALTALAATHGSRRYITAMFTTFVVFLLLLVNSPQDTTARFLERVNETILGVTLALIFGLLIPAYSPTVPPALGHRVVEPVGFLGGLGAARPSHVSARTWATYFPQEVAPVGQRRHPIDDSAAAKLPSRSTLMANARDGDHRRRSMAVAYGR